jgi:predicted chitinase
MRASDLRRFAPAGKASILQGIEDHWHYAWGAGINTPARVCHFLAQLAHESDGFKTTQEYASGAAYDTRTDLGNTPERDGDGVRYKGRGLIQVTGRSNYSAFTTWMAKHHPLICVDFVRNPEALERMPYALLSAVWYWQRHGLNAYADRGDLRGITKRINGGYNGLNDRIARFNKAIDIWGEGIIAPTRNAPAQTAKGGAIVAGGAAAQAVAVGGVPYWIAGLLILISFAAIGYIIYDKRRG